MFDYYDGIFFWFDEMEVKGYMIYSYVMFMYIWIEFNFVDYNFWDGVNDVFKEFLFFGGKEEKFVLVVNVVYQCWFCEVYDFVVMMGFVGGLFDMFCFVNVYGIQFYKDFEGKLFGEIV